MVYASPSHAPFFLAANNLRLADVDLSLLPPLSCGLSASLVNSPSSFCFSPAPRCRIPLADLQYSRTNHVSPSQSPRRTTVSPPRSVFSLGSEARSRATKENREFTAGESAKNGGVNRVTLGRKRPAKLAIPESARLASLGKAKQFLLPEQEDSHSCEAAVYAVSSKRGRKDRMEDAYTASTHIQGNPKQAFFGVFDGHGGKHAAEFIAANLSRHISAAVDDQKKGQACLEDAMGTGYMTADAEFLDKHLASGACAVSAFFKEGEMVVANAGDCKAVLCRSGKAESLSAIHRASNEAERKRVEDLGGFVDCYNGVWRIQSTLAVTRGFGDATLKKWVSAEPAVKKIVITHDCEFLLLASDGLWDQMQDQEAVDHVRKILVEADVLSNVSSADHTTETVLKDHTNDHAASTPITQNKKHGPQISCNANASLHTAQNKTRACNELIHVANRRGNCDDITVMIVLLQAFAVAETFKLQ